MKIIQKDCVAFKNNFKYFQDNWKYKYLFLPNDINIQCFVFFKILTEMKRDNISHYYNRYHREKYDKYNNEACQANNY